MCGIAGELSWTRPPDAGAIRAMVGRLAHRGPDAEGFTRCAHLVLGHRRLGIIAPTAEADQPLSSADEQVHVALNGEIYNFVELRRELTARGARFRTRSDTEVLLEAYRAWGIDCLGRLNGMFAFALWDEREQLLLLARDRMGEKPLFFHRTEGNGLVFASDLDALRLHPEVPTSIDPPALWSYLALNYVPGDRCILAGVEKLPPAHALVAQRGRSPRVTAYWNLAPFFREKTQFRSERDAAECLAALIDDAVASRLVSDVPLGAFLSGGLDSTAVVSAMCRARPNVAPRAFSIGFPEADYDELPVARLAARSLRVEHTEAVLGRDAANALPRIMAFTGEPLADTALVPYWSLAALARRDVTVCLSGDGGDELFGGYPTYTAEALLHATRWVGPTTWRAVATVVDRVVPHQPGRMPLGFRLRQFVDAASLGRTRAHLAWRQVFRSDERRAVVRREWHAVAACDPFETATRLSPEVDGCDPLDEAMFVDLRTWLPDNVLVTTDRTSMAHSLEVRAPLLDHRLVEFAARLPVAWKVRGLQPKYLLKRSQVGRVPAEIIGRAKHGFGGPLGSWLARPLGVLGREAVRTEPFREWFDGDAVERLWSEHDAGRRDHSHRLFGLVSLALWLSAPRERRRAPTLPPADLSTSVAV